MMYSTNYALKPCFNCGYAEEPGAKFCGHCGASCLSAIPTSTAAALTAPAPPALTLPTANLFQGTPTQVLPPQPPTVTAPQHVAQPPITQILVPNVPKTVPPGMGRPLQPLSDRSVPNFAHVTHKQPASPELQQEAGKLLVLLARERLFLLVHWTLFVSLNIIGLLLSVKCYYEFIGDEMSKLMIAMTPFWFINVVALACMIPIKGTRREIARLKERISYVRFKIEFGHLM